MRYRLIPSHELRCPGFEESRTSSGNPSLGEMEAALGIFADQGWRVATILDGHIFVLEGRGEIERGEG